jgi:5-methylcytosine-specific restriction endonuclease McrA
MSSVIVLNKNYQFWTEASIHKVLKWYSLNKIEIVLVDESEEIGSVELRIKMPLVVRLLNFIGYKPKRTTIPYSAEAVYKRDDYTCQYWHRDENGRRVKYRCTPEDKSIDHVLPISRGGLTNTFENSVCACKHCNITVKRNRLPSEVGLELIRKPFVPKRNKDEMVIMKFSYNKDKLSHNVYLQKFLGMT